MAGSKSSSAKIDWYDAVTWELIPPETETDHTDVGMFEAECPCCGQVLTFRLFCTAVADETETDR